MGFHPSWVAVPQTRSQEIDLALAMILEMSKAAKVEKDTRKAKIMRELAKRWKRHANGYFRGEA